MKVCAVLVCLLTFIPCVGAQVSISWINGSDEEVSEGTLFDEVCLVACQDYCTNVIAGVELYNGAAWVLANDNGTIILNDDEENPKTIIIFGDVNFTLAANMLSVNELRCIANSSENNVT